MLFLLASPVLVDPVVAYIGNYPPPFFSAPIGARLLIFVLRPGFETPDCAYSGCQG
jgi:hypothetical protein